MAVNFSQIFHFDGLHKIYALIAGGEQVKCCLAESNQ
jgi:hypothetical protein